jgi:trehalose-6-phosphatase
LGKASKGDAFLFISAYENKKEKKMKDYKGIVFFDYDGTTVDEVDKIKSATPATIEALQKLKEN